MNRRTFFRSLILGGIVVPHVPKLILTGGWFEPFEGGFSGPPLIGGFRFAFDANPLTYEALNAMRDEMFMKVMRGDQ